MQIGFSLKIKNKVHKPLLQLIDGIPEKIVLKHAGGAGEAAEAMRITATDLKQLGVADRVVPEPLGGAQRAGVAPAAGTQDDDVELFGWHGGNPAIPSPAGPVRVAAQLLVTGASAP